MMMVMFVAFMELFIGTFVELCLSHLTGSYAREPKNIQDRESADLTPFGAKLPGNKLMETEISAHPKHRKK
jgi:hypothetical protein